MNEKLKKLLYGRREEERQWESRERSMRWRWWMVGGGKLVLCRGKTWKDGRVGQSYLWQSLNSFLACVHTAQGCSRRGRGRAASTWWVATVGPSRGWPGVTSLLAGNRGECLFLPRSEAPLLLSIRLGSDEPHCNVYTLHHRWFSSNCLSVVVVSWR